MTNIEEGMNKNERPHNIRDAFNVFQLSNVILMKVKLKHQLHLLGYVVFHSNLHIFLEM